MSKIDGLSVNIGGTVFIVPPMNMGTAKRTRKDRAMISDQSASEDDRMEAATRAVYASLLRNYPDLKIEVLDDLVTWGNMRRILPQIVAAWTFDADEDPTGKAAAETN